MTHLRSHPVRLPARRPWFAPLLMCLIAGCGPGPAAPPDPALVRLTAQAAPYGTARTHRLDLVADLTNPTPEELRGVYLEVTLVDGPTVTLEIGDVAPLGEGHAWHPRRLERAVGPEDFFGGPAEVIAREDATSLPQLWLVRRFEGVLLGYQVAGEERRIDRTEAVNQRLEVWNRQVGEEARRFRARMAPEAVSPTSPESTTAGSDGSGGRKAEDSRPGRPEGGP